MNRNLSIANRKSSILALILVSLGLAFAIGMFMGVGEVKLAEAQLQLIFLVIVSVLVLVRPYVGIILVISSLPIIDIIPSVPYVSSMLTLIGAITLGSFLLNRYIKHQHKKLHVPSGLLIGFLFVLWIILSNPSAALFIGNNDRYWFFTFIQLIVLSWLSAQLLDTDKKHNILMGSFFVVTVLSAIYAIQQGVVDADIYSSVRASGLAGGANSAARYFIVGLIFSYYLVGSTETRFIKAILFVGMVIIIIGIVKTVSRTGLLLLCGTIGMILLLRIEGRNQIRSIFLLIAFLTIVWIFSESLIEIFRSIFPAIRQGTDTIGLRYKLWEAGIRMFKDSMVRGVGIGQYTEKLIFYARDLLPYYRLRLGAHNMYIQALAETGLVGIIIFLSFLGTAMVKFWRGFQSQKPEISSLVKTWLVVFVVLLLGGVTKHDHYDKLLWMTAGISMCSLWNPLKDFDARSKD